MIWLLCLDPDPVQEFAAEMLTVLRFQELVELHFNTVGNYLVIGLQHPGRRHPTRPLHAALPDPYIPSGRQARGEQN